MPARGYVLVRESDDYIISWSDSPSTAEGMRCVNLKNLVTTGGPLPLNKRHMTEGTLSLDGKFTRSIRTDWIARKSWWKKAVEHWLANGTHEFPPDIRISNCITSNRFGDMTDPGWTILEAQYS